ncbi:iron complex transport system substrate-binding protein [Algoriphagus zhangzhouensis]|uniref:Iron complex transport system substrate-binding protein n=2 Tax=Algoriphagus zhangzhouensis TaxID=1073327 RepID=A0A1M7ZGH4_9BACT|nr:iron complex transport system substrate-binding protein [Algoriphagus zhangzhouensis]SHO63909.1 iron complex transport system substrate-binding protein [Algoriphagus zhangzhouensis]
MKFSPLYICMLIALTMACTSPKKETSVEAPVDTQLKVITAGGTITEVMHSLNIGSWIIATDKTSTFPASMQDLPSIGYRNQIKAEGILSLGPELVLLEEGYLNAEVVQQLKSSGLEIKILHKPSSPEETKQLVTQIGEIFNLETEANQINVQIDNDLKSLELYLSEVKSRPSAAFVMARGPETLFIAGEKTFAQSMFQLAGINSIATGFEEFVPLSPESLVSINPDYLVFFDSGIQSLGGKSGIAGIQGIKETKAFQSDQIISMDGHYLSGFGPRVGKAALELAKAVRKEK